jgi:hypothetical protein
LNVSADRYYQNEKLKQTEKNKIIEIIKKKELSIPKNISEKLYKELCDDIVGLAFWRIF